VSAASRSGADLAGACGAGMAREAASTAIVENRKSPNNQVLIFKERAIFMDADYSSRG
jgi:hypothetical protein